MNKKIYVTKPFLPPIEEFAPYLESIWESKVLTNCGPYHEKFEEELADYLGVDHISVLANGTLALVTALQALKITGEVITTPYSFVATSHSLLWNSIKPVFVDVEAETCNLDPNKIEKAITPQTKAIMPVHCYGMPCNVEKIQEIADANGLKVIYDAAHAFGTRYNGKSLLRYGNLSILSFHATKVFNTFEGGAIISPDAKTKQQIDFLRNFGHDGEIRVVALGINGKMNEIQSALGLLQLKYINSAIQKREKVNNIYRKLLSKIEGIFLLDPPPNIEQNYSYMPIFISDEYSISRDDLYNKLRKNNIYARKYFYPLISNFPMYKKFPSAQVENLPIANQLSEKVLCLPIYPDLEEHNIRTIVNHIADPSKNS